jgi:transcription termination factor Rho
MNERRRPHRRGRGPRPFGRPGADAQGEPNPYRDSDTPANEGEAVSGGGSAGGPESPSPGGAGGPEGGSEGGGAAVTGGGPAGEAPAPSASPNFPPGGEAATGTAVSPAPTFGGRGGEPAAGGGDDSPGQQGGGYAGGGSQQQANGRRNGRRNRGRNGQRREQRDQPQYQGERGGPPAAIVPDTEVTGWFDTGRDGGYVRRAAASYLPEPGDPFVPPAIVRQFGLRRGDAIQASAGRDQRGRLTVVEVRSVNGGDPALALRRPDFGTLIASYPERRLTLETGRPARGGPELTRRAIDLIAPIGYGQRALIVAPARAGKTMLLQAITEGVAINHPDTVLLVLLVDERPEEVSEMITWGYGEVVSSSFDQPAERHTAVSEIVLERARRLVELGKDVVIVLDSITRMGRAYNTVERGTGRTLSGGLDATAMAKPKAFFGSARSVAPQHGGGSLTIIATALVETGSRMDDVIFEEFKGTGNCEIKLDRSLAEKRIFPAIDVATSGTRREDKLFRPDQLDAVYTLRRGLQQMPPQSAMEWLIKRIAATQSNDALLAGL